MLAARLKAKLAKYQLEYHVSGIRLETLVLALESGAVSRATRQASALPCFALSAAIDASLDVALDSGCLRGIYGHPGHGSFLFELVGMKVRRRQTVRNNCSLLGSMMP